MLDFITFHAHLVAPDNRLETIVLAEPLRDIRTELHSYATLAGTTTWRGLWVRPEHLHHQARLPGLLLAMSVQFSDVVELDAVVGEEAAVKDEVLFANQRGKRESGERLGERLEEALVVLGLALAFEAIDTVHVVRLVVSAVEEELAGAHPLVGIEE